MTGKVHKVFLDCNCYRGVEGGGGGVHFLYPRGILSQLEVYKSAGGEQVKLQEWIEKNLTY